MCSAGVLFSCCMCLAGVCVQLVYVFSWCMCSAGVCVQLVYVFSWRMCSAGVSVQLVCVQLVYCVCVGVFASLDLDKSYLWTDNTCHNFHQ